MVRPTVVVNPRDDADFQERVQAALDRVASPADLQAQLRSQYPLAVVRARSLSHEVIDTWYVYRDGRWITSEAPSLTSEGRSMEAPSEGVRTEDVG
jgi:hypothetical protein